MADPGRRFGIDADVALHLAETGAAIPAHHALVAPTLLRSHVLARLYADAQAGRVTEAAARARMDRIRGLRIRLLGDRVQQQVAWRIAAECGWHDTFTAEYIAVARLQADVFVTRDPVVADAARAFVATADLSALLG